jgi:glycosyltransferase involved in cell wall biosynthesis
VVTRVGDLADLVTDGVNGFLVEVGDRATFVSRVRQLLDDDAGWAAVSAAARRAAESYVGLDHVTSLWGTHLGALVPGLTAAGAAPAPAAGS